MAAFLDDMNKRQKYNKEILEALQEIVEAVPNWRFQQIIQNIGISDGTDKFYEESNKTYLKLLDNKIYQHLVKKYVR